MVRGNEKSCVCNVFATPQSKNPVKSSLPSYANVKHTLLDNSIRITTPQNFGSGEFFRLTVLLLVCTAVWYNIL